MKTSSGKTAFQLAIENNKCEVVEYLMNLGADILSQPFANKRYNPRVGIFFKDKSMLCITIGTWDQDTALCDGGNKSRCAWLRKFKLLRKLKTCSFYYFVISLPSFTFTGPPPPNIATSHRVDIPELQTLGHKVHRCYLCHILHFCQCSMKYWLSIELFIGINCC